MEEENPTTSPTKEVRPAGESELAKFLPQFAEFDQFQSTTILLRGENPRRAYRAQVVIDSAYYFLERCGLPLTKAHFEAQMLTPDVLCQHKGSKDEVMIITLSASVPRTIHYL